MRMLSVLPLALLLLSACHPPGPRDGSGLAAGSTSGSDANPTEPLDFCTGLRHSIPNPCPYPYLAVDANTAMQICNDANAAPGTLISSCLSGSTLAGTWVVAKPTAQHLTATINCPGDPNHPNPNVWPCTTGTATVTFADSTTLAFGLAAYDAVSIQSCYPETFYIGMRTADGWASSMTLQLPTLRRGSFPLRDARSPAEDPNAAALSLMIEPPGGQPYASGTLSDGTLTFTEASQDPNGALAFTLDANVTAPADDVQEQFAIYCGDPNSLHAGLWLNFQSH